MRQGHRRVVLVSPTGSGKTKMLSHIAARTIESGRRALWLAHRSELIGQACDTLTAEGLTVGAVCASAATPPNPYAPIQVASVQTLLARNVRPAADMVLADEAHHFSAASAEWSSLLAHYDRAWIIGATATPERGDGCGLRECFDSLVVGSTVRELTDLGHLVACHVFRPNKPLEPGQIAQSPVDAYLEHAGGRRAVVFCKSVALAHDYAAKFAARAVPAAAISNETAWDERRLVLERFRRGEIRVLCNVYVLTEGWDDPGVSCCIIARGCGSAGMYLQMVGRILRPHPGKADAILLDLRGVSHEHGKPDDPRTYSLDGQGIRLKDPNSYCPVCGAPRVPPAPCESCGYEPSGSDASKPDEIVGVKLVPYAHLRADDDETRAKRLARWIEQAKIKNYRDGWWKAKFRAVYESFPSGTLVARARELMSGAEAAQ